MQKKTASKVIKAKMEEWLKSINNPDLARDLRPNIIVSGGCVASLLLGEDVNDFDVYIKDKAVLLRLVKYYTGTNTDLIVLDGAEKKELEEGNFRMEQYATALRTLKDDQIKIFIEGGAGKRLEPIEGKKYQPVYFSPNAISLSDKLQIVVRFYGTPDQVHETFDFIHATNYFTMISGIVTNLQAMESLMSRTLKYQGSHYPLTSIIRARKFIKRRWNIGAGELLKIMFQISQLDLQNPDVLEEQLIGVDVAYFGALIDALRNKYDADPNFELSSNYLIALIEKIFDEEPEDLTLAPTNSPVDEPEI